MWRTLPPSFKQCSGTLLSSENSCFIHLGKNTYVLVWVKELQYWVWISSPHLVSSDRWGPESPGPVVQSWLRSVLIHSFLSPVPSLDAALWLDAGCLSGRKSCCIEAENSDTSRTWSTVEYLRGRDIHSAGLSEAILTVGAWAEHRPSLRAAAVEAAAALSPLRLCRCLLVSVIQSRCC